MIEQHPVLGAEQRHCTRPPGRQGVGIEGDTQAFRQAVFIQRRDLSLQVAFEQPYLLHMVEQALAQFGGPGRRVTQQYRLTDACLEQLDPLRYRRLRQPQCLGGALETRLFHDRRQRSQQFVIEHQFS